MLQNIYLIVKFHYAILVDGVKNTRSWICTVGAGFNPVSVKREVSGGKQT
jgi:hypothetical protein